MAASTTGGTPQPSRREESNTGVPARSAAGAPLPPLPWLAWEVGTRVVMRYRLDDGLHDALGGLVEVAVDHVTVRTRRGDVRVEASTMVTGKPVPPPAW